MFNMHSKLGLNVRVVVHCICVWIKALIVVTTVAQSFFGSCETLFVSVVW